MAVSIDIVEGGRGRYTPMGWEIIRVATVTGVDPSAGGVDAMQEAVNAVIAVTGTFGAAHPTISTVEVAEFAPEQIASDIIRVVITYRVSGVTLQIGTYSIEVGTALSQQETNIDKNGDPIYVEYTYPDDYPLEPRLQGRTVRVGVTLSVLTPESSLRIVSRETEEPGSASRFYVGKVNSGAFRFDETAQPGTWIVMAITGRSEDGGVSYIVTYELQYRADGWEQAAVYVDTQTGRPPSDLLDDVGKKFVQEHEEADFNTMFGNLPPP